MSNSGLARLSSATTFANGERRVRAMARRVCATYISEVGAYSSQLIHSIPTIRYILAIPDALPLKGAIVLERPYLTDIHGEVFSAMSYDRSKSDPTPSTIGLSYDVNSVTGMAREEVEKWFAESWRYINSGVVVLNVMFSEQFSSPQGSEEKVAFQNFLRGIILLSRMLSSETMRVVAMGRPAEYTVSTLLTSMGEYRKCALMHRYPNPAIVSRKPGCDKMSQGFTFGHPGTSRVIGNFILRSKFFPPLSQSDFPKAMASMQDEFTASHNSLMSSTDELDKLFATLRVEKSELSTHEVIARFKRDMIRYHEMIMRDMTRRAIDDADVKTKAGKAAEWSTRAAFVKSSGSVASSAQVPAPSTHRAPASVTRMALNIKEESDDDLPAPTPAPKKKVVRRVRKVVKPAEPAPAELGPSKPAPSKPEEPTPSEHVEPIPLKIQSESDEDRVMPQPVEDGPTKLTDEPRATASLLSKLTRIGKRAGNMPPPPHKERAPSTSSSRSVTTLRLSGQDCDDLTRIEYEMSMDSLPSTDANSNAISRAIRDKASSSQWVSSLCKALQEDRSKQVNFMDHLDDDGHESASATIRFLKG